jgi:transcriptional regulator with XRE-family HTH domain
MLTATNSARRLDMFYRNRIRKARLSKGLLQIELANLTGICFTTLSRLERGRIKANEWHMKRLSRVLHADLKWLFPEAEKIVRKK